MGRGRQADAPLVSGGEPHREPLPGAPVVRAPEDPAARTTPVEPPRLPEPLVGRGVHGVRVAPVTGQVHDPGHAVDEEDLRPAPSAVRGPVDAPFPGGRPEVAQGAHQRDVRVGGIHQDPADGARSLQTQVRPAPPPVRGSIHPVAPGAALAVVLLPCAGPDHVVIRGRHRDHAERAGGLAVEYGLPRGAMVRRLPEASRGAGHPDRARVARQCLDVVDAAAHDRGSERTEAQLGERVGPLGGGGSGEKADQPESRGGAAADATTACHRPAPVETGSVWAGQRKGGACGVPERDGHDRGMAPATGPSGHLDAHARPRPPAGAETGHRRAP